MVDFVFDIFYQIEKLFCAVGQIFNVLNGQVLKKKLAIWSH